MFRKILSSGLIIAESTLVLQVPCSAEDVKQKVAAFSSEGNAVKNADEGNTKDKVVKIELDVVSNISGVSSKKEENKKPWYRFGFIPGWVKEIIAEFDLSLCALCLISALYFRKDPLDVFIERLATKRTEKS